MIALLPIKENSDRVPGKNWRNFCGKPLYRWILDALLAVDEIEKVVINTDSDRIKKEDRVIVRKRLPELCGDMVSMNDIIVDDVLNNPSRDYLQTHATNPLISSKTIAMAIDRYKHMATAYDSMMSVNRIQNRLYWQDGSALNHDPNELLRTQDLSPIWEENSCLYLFPNFSVCSTKSRVGRHPAFIETPPLESIDIDTENDWHIAEAIAKL